VIKFIYDAEGIRKVKIVGGCEVKYLMDELAVLCEYDGSGNIKREYVPGISMKENGKTYYYITDRLGNVRYVTESSGSVVQSYLYSPFGKIHTSSGSLTQPYQYVGEEFYYTEGDIGLKLLGYRWYDSDVGRFISRDPIFSLSIFLAALKNLYFFVSNNVVNEIDPLGLHTYIREVVFWKKPDFSSIKDPCDPLHRGTIIAVQIGGFNKWKISKMFRKVECGL